SSRRRHTRCLSDWSSDVCSSDLLLAKAGDESVTPPEAQALTAKAAELMAKYGIDRALLAADKPETDRPADQIVTVENPWGRVKEIGRASCRERGYGAGGGVAVGR